MEQSAVRPPVSPPQSIIITHQLTYLYFIFVQGAETQIYTAVTVFPPVLITATIHVPETPKKLVEDTMR